MDGELVGAPLWITVVPSSWGRVVAVEPLARGTVELVTMPRSPRRPAGRRCRAQGPLLTGFVERGRAVSFQRAARARMRMRSRCSCGISP